MSEHKICIEVRRDDDDGYLYVVFKDRGEEFTMIASGSDLNLGTLFDKLEGITGRNI